jgi:hypothetical protein
MDMSLYLPPVLRFVVKASVCHRGRQVYLHIYTVLNCRSVWEMLLLES